ncbi:glycosyltransferase [Singulisphaera sp. PoT]|uniref:glycosyltransferase n=1 Tax=Singulisphaera sp. PoT TaxID=3411797 RepID=UPI003BF5E570
MSRIDVIIPCYQYGRFLRQCVESVLSQSHEDLRVLIIDDASKDKTAEVAEALVAEDHRVTFRRHTTNIRHIATFNEGLAWATGEYTVLISADDMLAPGSLARSVRLLDAHPEVGFAYGPAIVIQTDEDLPEARSSSKEDPWNILSGPAFIELCCDAGSNLVSTPTVMVRTSLQHQLGGYRPDLPHSADMEMWMRFGAHAAVGLIDADQAYYRLHDKNMSRGYFNGMDNARFEPAIADLRQRKAAFDVFFETQAAFIADVERLRKDADRGLAWEAFWGASAVFEQGGISGCDAMLEFALEIAPELVAEPEWSRMRFKRRLGPRLWSTLRPVVGFLRPRSSTMTQLT